MTVQIPSIHYLAILPVLIFFGAALTLLVATALLRAKVSVAHPGNRERGQSG